MRALMLWALALPAYAAPVGTHPFPWITGQKLLEQLNRPASAGEAVTYLKGVVDATADRDWCYSQFKPDTAQLQATLTDGLRALSPAEARNNAAALAVRIWREHWPCRGNRCCHA
jgi:hypothetical protein